MLGTGHTLMYQTCTLSLARAVSCGSGHTAGTECPEVSGLIEGLMKLHLI